MKNLPLLVLTRRGAVPIKKVLVILFLVNTRDLPEITTSAGAKFGDFSALQHCTGNFYGSDLQEITGAFHQFARNCTQKCIFWMLPLPISIWKAAIML